MGIGVENRAALLDAAQATLFGEPEVDVEEFNAQVVVDLNDLQELTFKAGFYQALDELRKANKGIRRLVAKTQRLQDQLIAERARANRAFRDGELHGRKQARIEAEAEAAKG